MKMSSSSKSVSKIHPKEKTNFLSHLLFFWEIPILLKGYKKKLTENEVFSPLKTDQSKFLGDKLNNALKNQVESSQSGVSLWKALRQIFGIDFAFYGLMIAILELIRIYQIVLFAKLLQYYTPNNKTITKSQAYLVSLYLILIVLVRMLGLHLYWFETEHLGLKVQVALSSVIYRKCLKLSNETLSEVTLGQSANLLSNDVTRFHCGLIRYVHYVWLIFLQVAVILYYLHSRLGVTAIYGISVFLICVFIQIFFFKKITIYRLKASTKTDQRVKLMNEIIQGIKVVKMFTWERLFSKLIETVRRNELQPLKRSFNLYAIDLAFHFFIHKFAIFVSIAAYVSSGHNLTTNYVYLLSTLYEIVKTSIMFFSWGALGGGEMLNSIKRIENFLKNEEVCETKNSISNNISIDKIYVKRNKSLGDYTLSDVTMQFTSNKLIAIVGPVGSGKTTLLLTLLNELPLAQGSVQTGNSTSYASQEPWLFGGSVRDNIIFGETFDETKYQNVIKVCALERDFFLLPYGDLTFVGDKGARLSGGQKARINLARAVYKNADFYLLDDPLSAVDAQVSKYLFQNCIKNYLKGKCTVWVTHNLEKLDEVDQIFIIEKGKIIKSGTFNELKEYHYFKPNSKTSLDEIKEKEQTFEGMKRLSEISLVQELEETYESGSVTNQIYCKFLSAGGFICATVIIILLILLIFTTSAIDYFLAYWVNYQETQDTAPFYFLYLYIVAALCIIIFAPTTTIIFARFCLNAAKNLHTEMFNRILFAPMSFFNDNPSGRILNRFAYDLGLIDKNLTASLVDTTIVVTHCISIITVICFVNYWVLIPTLFMAILFYYCRNVYLYTSRNLKRLEAKSCGPIFSHLISTLQGLPTIRAFKAQKLQTSTFFTYQDTYTSSSYMFLACSSAFGFWIDFCCVIYLGFAIFSPLFLDLEVFGGSIGLAISQCFIMIGMLQYGIKQNAELENSMVSVERVVEYSKIEIEKDYEKTHLEFKPTTGSIVFQDVSLQYNCKHSMVLKELSFTINPGEKIGIVGRTGAGKSSLISIFFRMFHFEGNVFIDGVNIKEVSLENLRSQISIITQEPVLFSYTIRKNLDPFEEYEDSQLWKALDEVELRQAVSELPFGLHSKVTEGGLNFSVGQRQLLCLARAMLKMNKILILDEVTANVDLKTDELIQKTLGKKFKNCTVLTIAHRLETVVDCDRILVMDDGRVKEFDSPAKLLENEDGTFYKLLHSAK
nr:PREDICTED: probable multidrug resistance-associated protein lethal(2)03659 isoform X2 [Tribolium castaneum]|eukprot:XP_015837654.1 PREDICTED: probable multidrug resistance-associated protein lethal(2)03659 isoform X2 [Tribolium castaneum]